MLSLESEEVGESVVPALYELREPRGLVLGPAVGRHVLLAADAEKAADGAAAHWTPLQPRKAACTNARVSATQACT